MSNACEDSVLDREIEPAEIARCLHSLKNNKTGGSDGLVGELLKYIWWVGNGEFASSVVFCGLAC